MFDLHHRRSLDGIRNCFVVALCSSSAPGNVRTTWARRAVTKRSLSTGRGGGSLNWGLSEDSLLKCDTTEVI